MLRQTKRTLDKSQGKNSNKEGSTSNLRNIKKTCEKIKRTLRGDVIHSKIASYPQTARCTVVKQPDLAASLRSRCG